MTVHFSDKPGCQESYLMHKHVNALLSEGEPISQQDVDHARATDTAELEQFKNAFVELMQQAVDLDANEESDVILKIKEDLDHLYEQCSGLCGDVTAYKTGIQKLVSIVMKVVQEAAEGDALAQSELDKEAAARAAHYQLLEYPLVSHIMRADSPVQPDELVGLILGGEVESARFVLSLFEAEQLAEMEGRAAALLGEFEGAIAGAPYAGSIYGLIREMAGAGAQH